MHGKISKKIFSHSLEKEIECEDFSPIGNEPINKDRLVVVSYNIRYAVGSNLISGGLLRKVGISRPSRRTSLVENNIQKAAHAFINHNTFPKPDVIALQEADKETLRTGRVHVARELAKKMSWNYAHSSLSLPREHEPQRKQWYLDFEESIAQDDTGETGLAFLSKYKLHGLKRMDLPWFDCPWRPRIALAATLKFGNRAIRLFNSHIDPHASVKEQQEQHEVILEQAETDNLPTILLGDFNTLTPGSRKTIRKFLESCGYATPFNSFTSTWRAGLYKNHTDWIFTRGLRCLRYGVIKSLRVSDHFPIWAEIDLVG